MAESIARILLFEQQPRASLQQVAPYRDLVEGLSSSQPSPSFLLLGLGPPRCVLLLSGARKIRSILKSGGKAGQRCLFRIRNRHWQGSSEHSAPRRVEPLASGRIWHVREESSCIQSRQRTTGTARRTAVDRSHRCVQQWVSTSIRRRSKAGSL